MRDEALVVLRQMLARLPKHERQKALHESAVSPARGRERYPVALEILLAAGADQEEAEAIRASRPVPTRSAG